MSRTARLSTPVEGAQQPTVVVPVVFDDGLAVVAESVPTTLGGHELPRSFSKEWCAKQGFKEEPGSAVILRSFEQANVVLVSLGLDLQQPRALPIGRRVGGAQRRRRLARLLPADRRYRASPHDAAQALVEGALLASYSYKKTGSSSTFDVVPLGSPLPSVETHNEVTEGVAKRRRRG